jgi:hypothetical protein
MRVSGRTERVASKDVVLATVFLVGMATLGYGYFGPSKVAFYAGLFVTIGGAILGAMRLVLVGSLPTHDRRGTHDRIR